jgi:hypothetical protein
LNHEKIPFVLTDVLAVIPVWLLEEQQRQEMKWTWTALPMK